VTKLPVSTSGANRPGQGWLDMLAFFGGLAMAWFWKWDATDLIWSLWLSSLMICWANIIWYFFSHLAVCHLESPYDPKTAKVLVGVFLVLTTMFICVFGGIHLSVARYLKVHFPVGPAGPLVDSVYDPRLFAAVIWHYWYFVPLTLIAERQAFQSGLWSRILSAKKAGYPAQGAPEAPMDWGDEIIEPFKSGFRIILMMGYVVAIDSTKLGSFPVYATVYVLYFFPWRLFRGKELKMAA
jgi:hypothetical protein